MDDKTKLANALKEAIAEVDKLIKAWNAMLPTPLEFRHKGETGAGIRVYHIPETMQIAEINQYTAGDYTLIYTNQSTTASEIDSILKKISELNGDSPKSPVGEVIKWNKFTENTPPRAGRYLVARKDAQLCVTTWMSTWWDGCVFTDFDNFPDENWVTHWMEIP